MPFPYEVSFEEVQANLDSYVDTVFAALTSDFLVLPRGNSFVEYAVFDAGYEALKRATGGFSRMLPAEVLPVVLNTPISLIVLRCVLGFTPPGWAYLATQQTGIAVTQGAARALDKRARSAPLSPMHPRGLTASRIQALVTTACKLIQEGPPETAPDLIHRLDKADTHAGLASVQSAADLGLPYPVLLYERYLGRPFAGHRDAVSELVGDIVETAIEGVLSEHGVSYRKTKCAEKVPGFDQAPDFFVPNEFNPRVIIEAKLTEDDGTARDKVTRIENLRTHSLRGTSPDAPRYEVVACIAGRGFGVRREDMRKLVIATRGKVFTLQNVEELVTHTSIRDFVTRLPGQN